MMHAAASITFAGQNVTPETARSQSCSGSDLIVMRRITFPADMMTDRMRRGLWAWGSGVATMLIAVAYRDKGLAAIDAWYVSGMVGAAAMFVKAVASDDEI